MKSWYEIKNKTADVLDISLHDEIGLWGVSAADFIAELKSHHSVRSINLSIHSPGGNALDGLAMYNALIAHPAKVHAHVDGLAASAASIVLMAGDIISMPEDAFLMIHNPFTAVMGGSEEMRQVADTLDKIKTSLVNIYQKKTGLDVQAINTMMNNETWLSADDALSEGFIDTITNAVGVAAKANVFSKYFKTMPIDNSVDLVNSIETERDFERFLRESGGVSNGLATALTSRAKALFQGEPETEQEQESMTALLNRLNEFKVPQSLSD